MCIKVKKSECHTILKIVCVQRVNSLEQSTNYQIEYIMSKYKQFIIQLPEYYLIALSLLATYALPFSIKPIAMVMAVIFTLQIIYKNKTTGHIIASLFFIANIFMLFAFISDLNELPRFNVHAKELLFGGLLFLGFNIFISALMLIKYPIKGENHHLQTDS